MSSITINLGDAFLLDTPPNGQHLYIAIAQTSELPTFMKETRFLTPSNIKEFAIHRFRDSDLIVKLRQKF